MTREIDDFVARLTPAQVTEVTDNLLTKKKAETRSEATLVASLLVSQLKFLGRGDLAEFAQFIHNEL